jgi:hypothetical protein
MPSQRFQSSDHIDHQPSLRATGSAQGAVR